MHNISVSRARAASLAILTVGMTFGSLCSAADIKNNALAGTMDFFQGWVEDLLVEVIPTPAEFVGVDPGSGG